MNAQIAAMDKSLDDLYQKLDDAKNGYKALLDGMTLGENQLLAQIQQAKTQGNVLYLTEQSTQNKLGLTDGSSDPQKIAEEGVAAVKIKNDAAILQTQAQLNLAKSNLELAGLQADSLIVRSPIDGTVGDILAHEGDLVGQQVMLAQIYGQRDFDLDVGVDSESADLITDNSKAEIMIGGRYIPVPIRNISPVADSLSKLVTVTLGLPKINFRINQSLRVRISINDNSGASISSVYVPLDAVIIATEEQYVYVLDGGKAVKKTVKTGEVSGDQIQILEGLSSSDKVIVDGAKSLIDGQEVTLQ
jgi:RND family efflux transporter MFP subunit